MSNNSLVDHLISSGYLKTPEIIGAFKKIDRVDFVPDNLKSEAYEDAPLPIGHGQTISQPATVAFMLELLEPRAGDKILDIGFGSGWTTALMAEIVSSPVILSEAERSEAERRISSVRSFGLRPQDDNKEKGRVYAIERIPELCELGRGNMEKYEFIKKGIVECFSADGTKGLPDKAPFDKILAGASAKELPGAWKEQLKIGGRIVAPIEWSVWFFIKKSETEFEEMEHPGFAFVPLISLP
ncbi:MAG: protein-L-isoaspartate O-methyltransferase [Candidatus Portnoybacteria bacterium CG11_big_fil_rev_8_21_14_0_20_44_10]|uniref:Protein-L-isoaspartate O-methyltransferase n=2 Tax=Candidatus Portnoyibacteriota TaxID=1817913 RepID=A0A2H0KTK9_9BACT|nr:MAG: protein-L-isoaspartate O-methyltransferase [Candidatus Portnoybacteria bacterium CG11_big_fil_rev_8_21_14_0_20_44_10]